MFLTLWRLLFYQEMTQINIQMEKTGSTQQPRRKPHYINYIHILGGANWDPDAESDDDDDDIFPLNGTRLLVAAGVSSVPVPQSIPHY